MPTRLPNPMVVGPEPDPISLRTLDFAAGTLFPPQRAPWGKLLFPVSGVADFTIACKRYLSPPAYAIWIPPEVLHDSRTTHATRYASVYVGRDLCHGLPDGPSTLSLSLLVRAIVADFAMRDVTHPSTAEDNRLSGVLLDQLRLAPRHESYLPSSDDALLSPVLSALQDAPGDRRSLAEWARTVNTTERTLSRRCQASLGLSFHEWRQRLKLVTALTLLEAGQSVKAVAHQLGYGSTSAFIAMFRQLTGKSPARLLAAARNHPAVDPRSSSVLAHDR